MKRGTLIVLSGSSGVGKSTVIGKVLEARPDIHFSVSFTTRAPREGEVDGVSYNFVSREDFETRIARGEFLEYAEYAGNLYGTSMAVIREHLDAGTDVLLDIEVQGAAQVAAAMPESVSVFLSPPSMEELERYLEENEIDVAVLTVPKDAAIPVSEALIGCGIKAIWNFTNVELVQPDSPIIVENMHFSDSLLALSYYMTARRLAEREETAEEEKNE